MNSIKIIHNSTRPVLFLATALLTITNWGFPVISSAQNAPTKQETASAQKVQLMFVQTSEDLKVNSEDKTLRLVNVNPQTLYFSDRPKRVAGNLTMPAYFDEWTAKAGSDNFKNDPPNATLSVYEGNNKENTLAVIEISNPVMEGKDLIYKYKIIEGELPKSGGATALFIDWIGAGGGVGPGFHGVGAGTRGVGLTGGYGGPAR
ncbi:MAG: hypothetical protein KA717_06495 [Woronichinia naegeliana WA131]|jgi:hypothetical protein|uniref:Uncharacterized protein n=1 Tax=Woronichinia naegeliana WA131 TaxID=2824559 RepID=A0A977PYF6_9CYAN|nr:MAG: hypothetical protein KA717_06495 [Woronichinia naegeliana WA131]